MKIQTLRPQYVAQLPDQMEEGVLYVCEEFDLTAHKCCCGCGEDVFNKLNPAKWQLQKSADGSVSLHPSVGNWKYACKSHYWVKDSRVIDAGPMDASAIYAVQQRDKQDRDRYIAELNADSVGGWRARLWKRVRSLAGRALRRLKTLWPW